MGKKSRTIYSVRWVSPDSGKEAQHFDSPSDAKFFSNLLQGRGRTPSVHRLKDFRKNDPLKLDVLEEYKSK